MEDGDKPGWEMNFFAHLPQWQVDAKFYQPLLFFTCHLFPEIKFIKENALAYFELL